MFVKYPFLIVRKSSMGSRAIMVSCWVPLLKWARFSPRCVLKFSDLAIIHLWPATSPNGGKSRRCPKQTLAVATYSFFFFFCKRKKFVLSETKTLFEVSQLHFRPKRPPWPYPLETRYAVSLFSKRKRRHPYCETEGGEERARLFHSSRAAGSSPKRIQVRVV